MQHAADGQNIAGAIIEDPMASGRGGSNPRCDLGNKRTGFEIFAQALVRLFEHIEILRGSRLAECLDTETHDVLKVGLSRDREIKDSLKSAWL
ncbi:hypothetical protein U1872_19000 [Sphingomonas sp. RB3P16]